METWNRLTVARGDGEGDNGGRRGRDQSKNMCE